MNVTPESIQKDYEILKENLPIQIGIDHLDLNDDNIFEKNKILHKLNLLNVGQINDVKLENNSIKISDAEITNSEIKKLYDQGELNDFSPVFDMYTTPCPTGKADHVEQYSVIQRVDFVPTGACETCKVDQPLGAANSSDTNRFNAKAIIGSENMVDDTSNSGSAPAGSDGNDPDDIDQDAVLQQILEAIQGMAADNKKSFAAIEGNLGIKEAPAPAAPDANADPNAPADPAKASGSEKVVDPEMESMKKEFKEMKAKAAKAEATAIVAPYLEQGKILPANVEKHVAMAMKAPEDYKVMMEDAAVIIDMDKHVKGKDGKATSSLVDEDGEEIDLKASSDAIDAAMGIKKE